MNDSSDLYPRLLKKRITEAMTDTPVILIAGPRQAGKTTLVRQFSGSGMRYITLDDEVVALSVEEDPVGLIRGLDRAIIDEIQRAPRLLTAIKKTVDEDRRPGRFLLTGSANLMALSVVADSLAGRMETLRLLPLSQSELRGTSENWVDAAFAGHVLQPDLVIIGDELTETVLRGGYPEAVSRTTQKRRKEWCRQYIDAILQRDVQDVVNIEKLSQMPKLLQTLAHYSGQVCNYSRIGGHIELDQKSIARYIAVLEHMFLVKRIPVFSNNRLKRLVKTPKIHFINPGLLAALQDMSVAKGKEDRSSFGNILETFVYSELLKHTTNAEGDYRLSPKEKIVADQQTSGMPIRAAIIRKPVLTVH